MKADEDTPERRAMLAEADEHDERMGSLWSMSNRDWQQAHWRLTFPLLLAAFAALIGLNILLREPMTAPRRRWSFSLRTLFVVVTVLAVSTGLGRARGCRRRRWSLFGSPQWCVSLRRRIDPRDFGSVARLVPPTTAQENDKGFSSHPG